MRRFIEQDPWGVSPLPYLQNQPWEYVQCKSCSQMFHKWLLTPQWQEVRFKEWMNEEAILEFERTKGQQTPQARFSKGIELLKHALRIEKMTRSIRKGAAVRVIDYGCGWGEFLVASKLVGFEAYGIERAPDRQ